MHLNVYLSFFSSTRIITKRKVKLTYQRIRQTNIRLNNFELLEFLNWLIIDIIHTVIDEIIDMPSL